MSLVLTISARESKINHNGEHIERHVLRREAGYVKVPNLTEEDRVKNQVSFLAEGLRKEVMTGPTKQRERRVKTLKKLQKGFVSILGAVMLINPVTAFAQTIGDTYPAIQGGMEITPNIVMSWGLNIALMTVAIGVALSGALFAIAGIYRMFRKRREAEEWTTDIIKGLIQVLIAVPTVYALFHLAQIVFKSLPVLSNLL